MLLLSEEGSFGGKKKAPPDCVVGKFKQLTSRVEQSVGTELLAVAKKGQICRYRATNVRMGVTRKKGLNKLSTVRSAVQQ